MNTVGIQTVQGNYHNLQIRRKGGLREKQGLVGGSLKKQKIKAALQGCVKI